jgi:hypothetical protein
MASGCAWSAATICWQRSRNLCSSQAIDSRDIDQETGDAYIAAEDLQINFDANLQDFIQARYTPACIRIDATKTDLSPTEPSLDVGQIDVPFQTYIWDGTVIEGNPEPMKFFEPAHNFIAANKQSRCTVDFWVIYMCGAFQINPYACNDPNGTGVFGGYAYAPGITDDPSPPDDAHSGLLIFSESKRDIKKFNANIGISTENLRKATVVHETGHMWGLNHVAGDGSIMLYSVLQADTQNKIDNSIFSGQGLKHIIQSKGPGIPE